MGLKCIKYILSTAFLSRDGSVCDTFRQFVRVPIPVLTSGEDLTWQPAAGWLAGWVPFLSTLTDTVQGFSPLVLMAGQWQHFTLATAAYYLFP